MMDRRCPFDSLLLLHLLLLLLLLLHLLLLAAAAVCVCTLPCAQCWWRSPSCLQWGPTPWCQQL